jgi:signal transduction histidine kinase
LIAFVVVSLGGTILFFGVARQYSNREIRDFLYGQDQTRLVNWLVDEYEENGWEAIGGNIPKSQFTPPGNEPYAEPVLPFILVNADLYVVKGNSRGGDGYAAGDRVAKSDLANALEITYEEQTIGWLVLSANDLVDSKWGHPILERMDELLLISAGGAMVLALLLGLVFSRSLSKPLRELSEAAQIAATGDFSKKVEVTSKDEIGILADSFNQMMEDLERMISSRRQMTADIAHELRTPISVILGYTEGVYEGVLEPTKETFDIVHDEAIRLERLVKDLRLISKADVGELPLETMPVSVESIVSEVEKTSIGLMGEYEISLEIVQPPDLPDICVDPNRIIQVIRNIIENSARYSSPQDKITLAVENESAKFVRFSIEDQGPGVAEEDLSKIFNRFYRVDPSRTRDQDGSGLGLAIARSIIEQHGGMIWAESPSEKGLKISFRLPVSPPEEG